MPLFAKKSDFMKRMVKPEKIEIVEQGCGPYEEDAAKGVTFYFYQKRKIKYLVYKNSADFEEIEFIENSTDFFTYKNQVINWQSTLDDLKRMFPKSYKAFKKEKNTKVFRLKFLEDQCEDQIQFIIKKGKIIRMNYWTPC